MQIDSFIDSRRQQIIENTQKLIRIPSVEGQAMPGKPFGEEADRALLFCLDLAKELGFRTCNLDGYAGYAEMGEGDKTLAILVHLDVVPEGTDWTYPPYEAQIHDGRIYGRGAIDDKGPAIAALYAMKAVMDSGARLDKKVRMIFGLDEESGWKDLEYYFTKESMPDMGIAPDGCYPVIYAEKGIMDVVISKQFAGSDGKTSRLFYIKGGERSNMVPDSCECVFKPHGLNEKVLMHIDTFFSLTGERLTARFDEVGSLIVKAGGISAHGSRPEKGKNAIAIMLSFLESLGFGDNELEGYLQILCNRIGFDTVGAGLDIVAEDHSGALTLNLGTIEADATGGAAVLNIRYPVGLDRDSLLLKIRNALKDSDVEIGLRSFHKPLYIPKSHPLVKTLLEVYEEQTGQKGEAVAIGGGTYARALNIAVAFGAVFPGRPDLAHRKDEYIEIEDLILNARIYAHAISRL